VVLFVIIADVGLMLHQPALIHYVPPAFTQAWSATAPARVLTLHGNSRTWWPSRDVTSEVSSPMGGIPQLAPKTSYGYTCSILALAAKELIDDGSAPSAATVALLRLMNVREVVIPSMARRLTIPNPEPVVFASRVGVAGRDARLESLGMAARGAFERREIPTEFVTRVAQEMELASGRPLAERILVAGPDTPPQVAQANASASAVTFTVFDFMEAHDRVSFRYRADRPGYLRLAYSYFPDTRVRIDGHDARIWPDALGTMVVGGREGEHSVEVVFGRSPLRAALFALSLFGAFGLWLAVRFTSPRSMSQHTVSGS